MLVNVRDERDEDIKYLGFISAEDETHSLHATIQIFDNEIIFLNFMHGKVNSYKFQALDPFDYNNGRLFKGSGRGRKPEYTFKEMKNFINQVADLDLKLSDLTKIDDKNYEIEI